MLQLVYDSAWHLPAISFLSITVLFLVMARKLPFIVGFSLVFGWLIAADAWGNGAVSAVPANLRGYYGLLFVLIGDWRYFILVERYSLGKLTPLRWLRSAALPFLMPAVSLFFMGRVNERVNFFIYETGFLVIAGVILWVVLPRRRSTDSESRAFIKSLTQFEIAQYALWAVADLLLIFGHPWAMILRITANIFYYALFVPFVWWCSPDSPGRRKHFVPTTVLATASLAISFVALRASVNVPAAGTAAESPAALNFVDVGKSVRSLQLPDMLGSLPVGEVSGLDPYYQHQKRWKAISIENILRKGFGSDPAKMAEQDFVIKAIDGFTAFFPANACLKGARMWPFRISIPPVGSRSGLRKSARARSISSGRNRINRIWRRILDPGKSDPSKLWFSTRDFPTCGPKAPL